MEVSTDRQLRCFHCGEYCSADTIKLQDKIFCCEGCKMVYQLLYRNGLCDYYQLNEQPGTSQRHAVRKDKFAFLDNVNITQQLITFRDNSQTHVTFYLPQIHCSSCLYLLENLHKLQNGILSSRVNFARKEATIVFDHNGISLRQVAELLANIGYEPYISLQNLQQAKPRTSTSLLYQLGIAGFCFANIMLLSFPEYLGLAATEENFPQLFRLFSCVLALPVFLYSAQPFYASAWKSLRHHFLNIDAPIALAIIITFGRSVYEIASGTGSGYFDSMSGIVFFMLAGRVLQDKTYQQLSFERDYTAYFPVAVTVLQNGKEIPTALPDLKAGDTLLIHHEELIPADGLLTRGKALIDYSFVTGESLPVPKEMGELVYAGGKQTGGNMEILLIREVAQSYLTQLWSNNSIREKGEEKSNSFIHSLSRWFTYIVFSIALVTAVYWWLHDASKIGHAVTAILIIACPCALLLSGTFTNGNVLRILGRNRFYLRNAATIESIAGINHIVFDKTGTLTSAQEQVVQYTGTTLTNEQQQCLASLAAQSQHPLSKALAHYLGKNSRAVVRDFSETTGQGISGFVNGHYLAIGSHWFVTGKQPSTRHTTRVYIAWNRDCLGYFSFHNHYRKNIAAVVRQLKQRYHLSVLSGDNAGERSNLEQLMGKDTTLLFQQTPADKLRCIQQLQQAGNKVMMIGDGLNDAGALLQSNVGIAIAEDCNNFTPASDVILEAAQLYRLPQFIRLCRIGKRVIMTSFTLSVLYNITGLFFAVQGQLSPLIAAILMPASSFTILLVTFGSTNLAARLMKL